MFDYKFWYLVIIISLVVIATIILLNFYKKTAGIITGLSIFLCAAVISSLLFLQIENNRPEPEKQPVSTILKPTNKHIDLGLFNKGKGTAFLEGNVTYTGLKKDTDYLIKIQVKDKTFEKRIRVPTEEKITFSYEIDVSEFKELPQELKNTVKIDIKETGNENN